MTEKAKYGEDGPFPDIKWCETCQHLGDHSTEGHIPACPLTGHATPVEGRHELEVMAPNGTTFWIGVCDDHYTAIETARLPVTEKEAE